MGIRLGCAVRYFLEVGDWHGAKFWRKNVYAAEKESGAKSSIVRIQLIKQIELSNLRQISSISY